ncbi:hypothetical protein BKA62DRAFT_643501 [Auriculariales sp. MPI-PUGE-AT-0066]|nr:hypothetical protein BKA62DRAFT_643501 [Auriculariales sp. MPI-PUGE-AT-0066]
MSWCCGRAGDDDHDDTEPLLSQYEDDTVLQRELHKKMHTYQMMRALGKGYLPSTEQAIIYLRVILASDVLNPGDEALSELSRSGQLLVRFTRQWLMQFIELLRNKNTNDSIQDFAYFFPKARLELDTADMISSASQFTPRLDAAAAYESARIVGSLLFGNRDFRMFLADLNIIAREVFSDTAASVANVAEKVAERIAPTEAEAEAVKKPGAEGIAPLSSETVPTEVVEVGELVADGIAQTAHDVGQSVSEHLSAVERQTLLVRLQQTVAHLRKRSDYKTSVSTLQLLLQRYVEVYSRSLEQAVGTVSDDVHSNPELDRAMEKLWAFIGSFGDRKAWDGLTVAWNKVALRIRSDPNLEVVMQEVGVTLNKLFTDPDFFTTAQRQFDELSEKVHYAGMESSLRGDIDDLIAQAKITYESVIADKDVSGLWHTSLRLLNLVSPTDQTVNKALGQDALHVFMPLIIGLIQYIPIPRFELCAPELDLLVESLVFEPGKTVNNSSFFPFRLRVETLNEVAITKARFRTHTQIGTIVRVHAEGITIRADEVGFWLRAHSGFFRFADEGIASFALDERGIDITLEIEVGEDRLEKILSLKSASVKIHHFDYSLRKSKLSWLAWLAKPFLRPLLKSILEKQIAAAIEGALHAGNRELIYARERLRATRIADPDDMPTFFRAIMARLSPPDDPDVYAGVGVAGSAKGDGPSVFHGVYAPGSVVKLWEEEAANAAQHVDDEARGRWRNAVFDIPTMAMH